MSPVKLAGISHLYINVSNTTYDEDGNEHSFDDQPSSVTPSNTKFWYRHGKKHREDGPAWISGTDSFQYFVNGKPHRLDGPASRVRTTSHVHDDIYYINGVRYHPDKYAQAVAHWLSYREVTREDIEQQIGQFRIVEWE